MKEDTTRRDNKYSPGIEGRENKWEKSCSKSGLTRQGKLNYKTQRQDTKGRDIEMRIGQNGHERELTKKELRARSVDLKHNTILTQLNNIECEHKLLFKPKRITNSQKLKLLTVTGEDERSASPFICSLLGL